MAAGHKARQKRPATTRSPPVPTVFASITLRFLAYSSQLVEPSWRSRSSTDHSSPLLNGASDMNS